MEPYFEESHEKGLNPSLPFCFIWMVFINRETHHHLPGLLLIRAEQLCKAIAPLKISAMYEICCENCRI